MIRKALQILREQGPRALLRRVAVRLRDRNRVDETRVVWELVRAERPGVMVDVGAHGGAMLAPFAEAGWRVVAFEPDAKNRAPLDARFARSANVTIDTRAVSDQPATGVTLFRSDVSSGISGLSAFHASHVAAGTTDVTTLAAAAEQYALTSIDVLKVDTEGFDLFVLRGLPWDRLQPRAIVCEFEDAKTVRLGYTFHDLARFLVDHGYRVMVSEWFPVKEYGGHHTWRRFAAYPGELADPRAWGNLIAVRDDALWARLVARCWAAQPRRWRAHVAREVARFRTK